VLPEGTDTSQGTPQLLSNISACIAVASTVATTLGPRGMDKLIVDARGEATISNDGATILKLLDVVHPAAKTLVDIARAQDAEVGDGTTSVCLLAGELLKQSKGFVEDGVSPQIIIKAYRRAAQLVRFQAILLLLYQQSVDPIAAQAVARLKEIAVTIDRSDPECVVPKRLVHLLEHTDALSQKISRPSPEMFFDRHVILLCFLCVHFDLCDLFSRSRSSKLIHTQKPFFSKMVVEAVQTLDQDDLDESLIGIKKIPGGAMQESTLVKGVAFKKTFSYAGFEQQPKSFKDPKILCLNVELELKAERDNAEVRIEQVSVR
jgi:T-complex protein 1 subunit eta